MATSHRKEGGSYLELAERLTRRGPRTIVAMHGFAGCGKTTLSQALVEQTDVVRIRMDVERKRMENLAATARTGSGIDAGLYAPDMSRAVYDHVAALTEAALNAGEPIVVDAAFLKRWQRDLFRSVAQRCDARFLILDLAAPEAVLRERVTLRSAGGRDASEADVRVLEHQLATHDPLAADEQGSVVVFGADIAETLSSERWRTLVASLCPQPSAGATPVQPKTALAIGIGRKGRVPVATRRAMRQRRRASTSSRRTCRGCS